MAGLPARRLAELCGLANSYIAMLESGERQHPGSNATSQLARVLGCSLEWLIDGNGKEPSERVVKAAVRRAQPDPQPPSAE